MTSIGWSAALLLATAWHAGFQLTVSVLVYPALFRVPPEQWEAEHAQHSRRIAPLVGLVYGAVVVACAGTLLTSPSYAGWLAAASAAAMVLTAALAAPLHGRLHRGLGAGRDQALVVRLRRVDLARTVAALLAAAAAVWAVVAA